MDPIPDDTVPSGLWGRFNRPETVGPAAMGIGLAINGLAAYIFLAAAGRALGADDSGQVSVMWAVLYLIGTGLFLPLEQELSRSISARRARGQPFGQLVSQVSMFGGVLFLVVAALILVASPWIADALFRGSYAFVIALVYGIAGVGLSFVVRGLLAGTGRYGGYATFFVVDAAVKAIPAIALAVAGVASPLAFAIVVTSSAFVGLAVPMVGKGGTGIGEPGPKAPWPALRRSLSHLVVTALLMSVVMNSGTVAVEVLATPEEADKASVFLSGLVIARIPLFLFQAVQAVALPRLSHLAASRDMAGFRRLFRVLIAGVSALAVVAVIVSAAIGPTVVRIMFGDDFVLSSRDMGLLTLASMLMLMAITVNQAQIALHHQHETGWPWGVATVLFVIVTAVASSDLLLRVELGMVAAGASVALIAATLLARDLRDPTHHLDEPVSL